MKKDHTLLMGALFGFGIGIVLFALRLAKIHTGSSVPICLGMLVAVLDWLCLMPVFNYRRYQKLLSSGKRVDAYVSDIEAELINPKYFVKGPDGKTVPPEYSPEIPVTYNLELKYSANGSEQTANLLTPAVSDNELSPYRIYEGSVLPIKYMEKHPDKLIIDIPAISQKVLDTQRSIMFKGPFTAFVMTVIYIVFLITRVF